MGGGLLAQIAARAPLVYVHLVQVMVDTLLITAPFALYSKVGGFSVFLSVFLGFFHRGLLILSKSFLDPFGRDGSPEQIVQIQTLIAEVNAGTFKWQAAGR